MSQSRLAVEELVGPPSFAGQGAGDLQDPARGDPLDVAAQVTPRDAQHLVRRAGQGGEEVAVLALDALGAQGQFVAGRRPFVIGEERVVVGRRGEQALGQAEHDNQVEVEPDSHADRPDQHALAHPPDPAEVGLELELQACG